MIKTFQDNMNFNKLQPKKRQTISFILNLLNRIKDTPTKKAAEAREIWKKHGMDIPIDDTWNVPMTESEFSFYSNILGAKIGNITEQRKGYLTPMISKSCYEEIKNDRDYPYEREHFVQVITLSKYLIYLYCQGRINSESELWEVIYKNSGVLLVTKDENTELKNICKKAEMTTFTEINEVENFVNWMRGFHHYALAGIEVIHPDNLDKFHGDKNPDYYVDLVTKEMKEYTEKSSKELKELHDINKPLLEEPKDPENPLAAKFWDI
jgi:hypothetical protein